jgi:hypothetical protein
MLAAVTVCCLLSEVMFAIINKGTVRYFTHRCLLTSDTNTNTGTITSLDRRGRLRRGRTVSPLSSTRDEALQAQLMSLPFLHVLLPNRPAVVSDLHRLSSVHISTLNCYLFCLMWRLLATMQVFALHLLHRTYRCANI